MKRIRINLSNLSNFRKLVVKNSYLQIPDRFTLLDLIAQLDKKYHEEIKDKLNPKERSKIFTIDNCDFLLQVLWNPETEEFYEDTAIEVLVIDTKPKLLPIKDDILLNLPDEAIISTGPDAG